MRDAGVTVVEKIMDDGNFEIADEIFSTGNYSKIVPVNRIDRWTLP